MKKRKFLLFTIFMLTLSMVLAACGGGNANEEADSGDGGEGTTEDKPKFMSILTGGTGGTYFPLGGAFANIVSDATGIDTNAETTGASAENMQSIKDKKGEIAFTQTDIASYATEGKLMFDGNPIDNIQAIGTLYPETIQIVTTEKSGIKSVEDLKGKRVSIGAPGSGTAANAEQILEVHGLTLDDIKKQDLSFDESVNGIKDGNIDAAFVTAGTPTAAVEELSATETVVIVPVEADKADELIEKYPYYTKDEVPSGAYKLGSAVPTVAVQAMLVVESGLSEQVVYDITKSIFENLDKVQHAKAKQINPENALNGVGIDVHPGAQKYFDEKGIKPAQ
ncbi:C4-dicarboxylate ABC transporter substrate-binding protein [Mesobacillus campisalis]|uniref:C4-dicarboxylate ABC transporter substrate-binding protein n=1 Tax=Mesobacillus campisalis TaxID=1408103 RepID=A0A0M2SWK3_9BACI|nr:TAXI family TRAP transporter solute-binding subunit [Mesobacillus campisalis]KKK37005.1 C4-dicarboxylate ABC transporter substrate-binding protein [Mesobacillus campisalis]